MSETIYFNGQKFHSVAEMPPEVRRNYERIRQFWADEDADGTPDIVQIHSLGDLKKLYHLARDLGQMQSAADLPGMDPLQAQARASIIRETGQGIYVNNRFFESPEEMPQDIFEMYAAAVSAAGNAQPAPAGNLQDLGGLDASTLDRPRPLTVQAEPVNQVDTTVRVLVALAVGIVFLGILVPILWALFF